jgi:hypothetical protein
VAPARRLSIKSYVAGGALISIDLELRRALYFDRGLA